LVTMRKIMTQWLVDQFPGATREEVNGVINSPNGTTVLTFHISSYTCVIFRIEDVGFRMTCNFSSSLCEYFSFEKDCIVGGQWNENEEVFLGDPDFNEKLCKMLCRAVMVISMGAINPFLGMEREKDERRLNSTTS